MAQMGRAVKNLEPPRPLKSTLKQSHVHVPVYEVQSIEELITLTENVAASLANGCNNADGMNALLANLRLHGPQLETISKDTLDRAFVIFRNASQDERLNIMTRLNLLELIELRAKSWQVSDGINTYYKHKATNVETDVAGDSSLLGTSPPGLSLGQQIIPPLSPGELIRTSGKFPKPTKIPGKTYCKDEIVIRNADSGKVNPGAKERLVQITGPNEEKINYAKQLIEDTIRRNASPVRLDAGGGSQDAGSCSSLASSASDEMMPGRTGAGTGTAIVSSGGQQRPMLASNPNGAPMGYIQQQQQQQGQVAAINQPLSLNLASVNMYQQQPQPPQYTHQKLTRNGSQNNTASNGQQQLLLHSFSSNDASLGEYKYTVSVGKHNIKITGDCFDLVRAAKLVLDDYFSSNEFLAAVEMGANYELPSPVGGVPMVGGGSGPHQLITGSPFVDSGVGLDAMASGGGGGAGGMGAGVIGGSNCVEVDDDVFIIDPPTLTIGSNTGSKSGGDSSSASSTSTLITASTNANTSSASAGATTPAASLNNGLSRSRRSHFSRKDSAPEGIKDGAGALAPASKDDSTPVRIVHEYERLIYYSKSPHSWALPRDWLKICEKLAYLVRNKVNDTPIIPSKQIGLIADATGNAECNSDTNTNALEGTTNSNANTNTTTRGFFKHSNSYPQLIHASDTNYYNYETTNTSEDPTNGGCSSIVDTNNNDKTAVNNASWESHQSQPSAVPPPPPQSQRRGGAPNPPFISRAFFARSIGAALSRSSFDMSSTAGSANSNNNNNVTAGSGRFLRHGGSTTGSCRSNSFHRYESLQSVEEADMLPKTTPPSCQPALLQHRRGALVRNQSTSD